MQRVGTSTRIARSIAKSKPGETPLTQMRVTPVSHANIRAENFNLLGVNNNVFSLSCDCV